MMAVFLGIDTSNYTTSAALYEPEKGMVQRKQLLPVKSGTCGLRQSDAVFHHTQQLPEILESLLADFDGAVAAIGVSSRPRDQEGSYMPCFTVGLGTARALSAALRVPLYRFSHQSGHIAAAAFSAGCTGLLDREFLAFHVSGGTTEAVLVRPDEEGLFCAEIVGRTLDLNAGQLIDRVGVMMGLNFPCGRELEQLARQGSLTQKVRPTLKGSDCCLSGIENQCRRAFENGMSKEDTSLLCLCSVEAALDRMCGILLREYGRLPVLFAGGVMSNRMIRKHLSEKYGAYFAEPEFSADNAAGTAFLCGRMYQHNTSGIGIEK